MEGATPRPALIRLSGVARSYDGGHQYAVRAVDVEVAAGEFVAVVGPSGCGKTTLLKMINRLVEPDDGEVFVAGVSTRSQPGHVLRRRIGYVFQGVGLFPHLTVAQNIGITPRLLGWSAARIAARVTDLLTLVGLPEAFATRLPGQLSGGQGQRVGVARALAAEPGIMLMDEPFGALDPATRDALGRDYRLLHERMQLTTLMVTHDMVEAILLADRIVVMEAGAIVADGTPFELAGEHQPAHVRDLLDMPRRQARRVSDLLGGGASLGASGG